MTEKTIDWDSIPLVQYADAVQDGTPPLFVSVMDREGGTQYLLRRADGSLVRVASRQKELAPALVTETPRNTREYLAKWLERIGEGKLPPQVLSFKRRLLADHRMRDFWQWFEGITYIRAQWLNTSIWASEVIWRGTKMPGKPGNMTPAQRSEYFAAVRKHANALTELLSGTKFDSEDSMQELSDEELDRTLHKTLSSWGDDESEEGHVVAFQVTPDGAYRHHYDYPQNCLVQLLGDLREWTYWDDQWDGRFYGSSAPIVQSNSRSTPIVYFTCSTFDAFASYGAEMPFPILATIANVALNLPVEEEVDEEVVRRQVRRHQKRMAVLQAARPLAFEEGGQIATDLGNSVLLDPF